MTFFFSSLGHSRWFAGKHWETEQRHSIPHQAFTETIQGNRIFDWVVCLCTVPSPVICFFSFLLLFSVQQKLQHQMILLLELDKTELLCLFKFIFFIVFFSIFDKHVYFYSRPQCMSKNTPACTSQGRSHCSQRQVLNLCLFANLKDFTCTFALRPLCYFNHCLLFIYITIVTKLLLNQKACYPWIILVWWLSWKHFHSVVKSTASKKKLQFQSYALI